MVSLQTANMLDLQEKALFILEDLKKLNQVIYCSLLQKVDLNTSIVIHCIQAYQDCLH